MTLLALLVLSFFIPASWTKAVWGWCLHKVWGRSTLRLGVEVGGKKISSFKDEYLSKKNKPKEGDA